MNEFAVNNFIDHNTLRRLDKMVRAGLDGDTFYVYINSVGGCTRSALAIYEILRSLSAKGYTIITQVVDGCYSAAMIIYLAGDVRYATKYSTFMIHEVTVEEGKDKRAEGYIRTAKELEKETVYLYSLIKSRSTLTLPMIKKKVKEAAENDWLFEVPEAKRYGIVQKEGYYLPEVLAAEDFEDEEDEDMKIVYYCPAPEAKEEKKD